MNDPSPLPPIVQIWRRHSFDFLPNHEQTTAVNHDHSSHFYRMSRKTNAGGPSRCFGRTCRSLLYTVDCCDIYFPSGSEFTFQCLALFLYSKEKRRKLKWSTSWVCREQDTALSLPLGTSFEFQRPHVVPGMPGHCKTYRKTFVFVFPAIFRPQNIF